MNFIPFGLTLWQAGFIKWIRMVLTFNKKVFVARCSYQERNLPKDAKFRWHPGEKCWYTASHQVAARLKDFADEGAKKELSKLLITKEPFTGSICFPKNKTPYPFQITAVQWALERSRSYLALDPGLGKTICAAMIAKTLDLPFLYICPPFLKLDVEEKLKAWEALDKGEVFKDSLLIDSVCITQLESDLSSHTGPKILFVDEAHRFKNDCGTKRTKVLFEKIVPHFNKVVFLSGTPWPNHRPIELYSVLSNCAPETIDFMNRFEYGKKYCAAYKNRFGWDFTGSSNVSSLISKIKKDFLLRIKTEEVLKELPPIIEGVVILEKEMTPTLLELNTQILKAHSPEDLMKLQLGSPHIATYRRELGIEKVVPAITYLKSLLEETKEKILIFAIHREVISGLVTFLRTYRPLHIDGDVSPEKRHKLVGKFQSDLASRVMICNIQTAGVGFDMTAADRVVFVEFSWCPSDNKQAYKRVHRIGQKKNVLVQYLVYKNSVDRVILDTVFEKQKNEKHM